MTHRTQVVTTILARRRRPVTRRSRGPLGYRAAQDGRDPGEQVGHADQVAEDEVAIEADEREQLLKHLQMGDGDDQEQDLGG